MRGDTWSFYSDSDHAGDSKSGDARSTTGVIILLNGMPIFWRSNKQPKTSLSSACAEIQHYTVAKIPLSKIPCSYISGV